jgi:RNA methyltransferase, TrmH family
MPDLALSRRRLQEIQRLARRRHRDAAGQFLVEGVRSVESALAAGAPLVEVLATHEAAADPRVAALLTEVRRGETPVPVHVVSASELARVADTEATQGILAVAALRRAEPEALAAPLVVLDGVQDPGNVGAVVRASAWFGVRGVLVGPGTADPFGPKAVRAAMGGLWDLGIAGAGDLGAALDALRARGLPVYGADLDGEPARDWSPPAEAVLVLGSEAHGLSEGARQRLDGRVRIGGGEGARGVESLNVSVAAGILLHRWLGGA